MTTDLESSDICCPQFNPLDWDNKKIIWESKRFISDVVYSIFYIPLNFGKVMTRIDKIARNAQVINTDGLCLTEHFSMWKMNVLYAVDKEIPDVTNNQLSGTFFCKVYEGDFNQTGTWIQDCKIIAEAKGEKVSNIYVWYTTCPKCAKKYGKNYVAVFARLK